MHMSKLTFVLGSKLQSTASESEEPSCSRLQVPSEQEDLVNMREKIISSLTTIDKKSREQTWVVAKCGAAGRNSGGIQTWVLGWYSCRSCRADSGAMRRCYDRRRGGNAGW